MSPSITPSFDAGEDAIEERLSTGFHLLQATRRRQVIWYVYELGPGELIEVRELPKTIAAAEQGVPVDSVSNDVYRSVYTSLIQTHLPVLDETEVIDYDRVRKTIDWGQNTESVAVTIAVTLPVVQLLLDI